VNKTGYEMVLLTVAGVHGLHGVPVLYLLGLVSKNAVEIAPILLQKMVVRHALVKVQSMWSV